MTPGQRLDPVPPAAPVSSADARTRRAAARLGMDRMAIFVPAVMSVGLLVWMLTAIGDLARSSRRRNRAKQAAIAAVMIADRLDDPAPEHRRQPGLHPRPVYLLDAAVLIGAACYVVVGSVANYRRSGGYVSGIAWLLALSLAVALASSCVGVTALVTFLRHPSPPAWTGPILRRTALTTRPDREPGSHPGWKLTAATITAWSTLATLALLVGNSPHVVAGVDADLAGWASRHPLPGPATWPDLLARTAVPLVVLLGALLWARRCRMLLATGLLAAAVALVASRVVQRLVERPAPGPQWAGRLDSFPPTQIVLLALAAGLAATAAALIAGRPWISRLFGAIGAMVVVGTAYAFVAEGRSWPSDAVAALLAGAALTLSVRRALATSARHRICPAGCPLRPNGAPVAHRHGAVPLRDAAASAIRAAAHVSASVAAITLVVLSFTRGLPTNPDGPEMGLLLERPAQLGLAAMVSLAALLGWKWPGVGAVLLAIAATGLGVFAGVEYPPTIAVGLTVALMVPAVLLWLSWQRRRRPFEIAAVAGITIALITSTWVGASTTYDHYFGPTHPASATAAEPTDRVVWLWSGGLSSRSATVVAQLDRRAGRAALIVTDERAGTTVRSQPDEPDDFGLVRLPVDGLTPASSYRYVVEVDGRPDDGRGHGRFATPAEGPLSFRVAVASCARTASNGSVFDAIAAADPLLYLQIGDLHYQNLEATTPGPFVDAFGRALTQAAQAALARRVPLAYVWDDHDYGPNDAGADSPTRTAAQAAYRAAVPHGDLPAADGAIYQAFTIGRVRFVISDGRSERTADAIVGPEQERWLVDELSAASRTHALVVWVNGTPWIGTEQAGSDTWAGYAAQRRRIADALAAADVDNLVMLAGDAHMVAIDDGTHSGYAADGSPGFPVLQAAALDRPGSVKGGPYSQGAFPGGGQYGLLDITDRGDQVEVRLAGRRWDGSEPVTWTGTFPVR